MEKIYKSTVDCGRMGTVNDLFPKTPEETNRGFGKDAMFGEIVGKYSPVYWNPEESDPPTISKNPESIKEYDDSTDGTIDPLDYYDEDEDYDE